jgi:hypothetical protein
MQEIVGQKIAHQERCLEGDANFSDEAAGEKEEEQRVCPRYIWNGLALLSLWFFAMWAMLSWRKLLFRA